MYKVKNTAKIPLVIIIPNSKGTKKTIPVDGFLLLEDDKAKAVLEVYRSWGIRLEKVVENTPEESSNEEGGRTGSEDGSSKIDVSSLNDEDKKALVKKINSMTKVLLEEFATANEISLEGLESNKAKAEAIIKELGI